MAIEKLPGEVWEKVVGYEEFYEVSNLGRVKSRMRYARSGSGLRRVAEKLMTPTVHPDTQHIRVQLSKRGKLKTVLVYTLVTEAHGKPQPDGMEINHIDGDRKNNSIENLEWVSVGSPKTYQSKKASLNADDVREIRSLFEGGMPILQIADKMQMSPGHINRIITKKAYKQI